MVAFEDLHWADEALLEFLKHVVEWSTGVPLFVLCTALLKLAREIGDLRTLVPALEIAAVIRTAVTDAAGAVSLVREMAEHTKDDSEWRERKLPAAARAVISAGRPT